jgi:predicted transcriptional regulator
LDSGKKIPLCERGDDGKAGNIEKKQEDTIQKRAEYSGACPRTESDEQPDSP